MTDVILDQIILLLAPVLIIWVALFDCRSTVKFSYFPVIGVNKPFLTRIDLFSYSLNN